MSRADRTLLSIVLGFLALLAIALLSFRAAFDDSSSDIVPQDDVPSPSGTQVPIDVRRGSDAARRPTPTHGSVGRAAFGCVVRHADQTPIAEAIVTVSYDSFEGDTVATAADGRFSIALADPTMGRPRITVSARGYARFSRKLMSLAGEPKVDLGLIELETAASIEGTVLDAFDRPLSDVVVSLHTTPVNREIGDVFADLPELFDPRTPLATSMTSADGSFRFDDLDGGAYDLDASRTDFARAFRTDIRTSAGRTTRITDVRLEAAVPLEVTVVSADGAPISGASVIVFPALTGRDLSVALERHYAITGKDGRVVMDRLAAGNSMVMAMDDRRRIASKQSVPVPGSVTIVIGDGVEMRGLVRLDDGGRVPGRPLLTFVAGDQYSVVEPDANGRYAAGPFRPGNVHIMICGLEEGLTLAPGVEGVAVSRDVSAVDHDIVVIRGATVSGRVLDATTKAPIPDATVVSGEGPLLAAAPIRATTDAEGRFTLHGVRASRNTIFARASGYGNGGPADEKALLARPAVDPGPLEPGSIKNDVTLELLRLFAIKGRILDQRGHPVSGARVTGGLRSAYESALIGADNDHVVTGPDGRYEVSVDVEAPALLRIRAEHPEYFTSELRLHPTEGDGWKQEQDIVLERTAVLTGFIRDVSGAPIEGMNVAAIPEPSERRQPDGSIVKAGDAVLNYRSGRDGIRLGLLATTSADGSYMLRVPQRPTTIRREGSQNYCALQGPPDALEPLKGGPTRVPDFILCRGESAIVAITSDLRRPLPDVWVRLDRTGPDGYAYQSREIVVGGRAAGFSLVPIGSYMATVEIDDPATARLFAPDSLKQRIEVVADGDRRHTLKLELR